MQDVFDMITAVTVCVPGLDTSLVEAFQSGPNAALFLHSASIPAITSVNARMRMGRAAQWRRILDATVLITDGEFGDKGPLHCLRT